MTAALDPAPNPENERPAAPAGTTLLRATEVLSTVSTRLSFLVIAWLLLSGTGNWSTVGLVLGVQALAYLATCALVPVLLDLPGENRAGARRRMSVAADLLSAGAVAVVAVFARDVVVLTMLVGLLGVLRATSDVTKGSLAAPETDQESGDGPIRASAPPREGLLGVASLLAGAALGAMVAWLGWSGALWILGITFAACAATTVLASPVRSDAVPASELLGDSLARFRRHPLAQRLVVALFLTSLFGAAGAVALVEAWAQDTFTSEQALGILGGAVLLGAIGGSVVFTAVAVPPIRAFLLALGYVAGSSAIALRGDLPATLPLVAAVAFAAGLALASVTPVPGVKLLPAVPAALRSRAGATAAAVGCLGIIPGSYAAAWIALHTSLLVAVGLAAGCFLIAMLVPVLAHREWRRLDLGAEQPVPILRRTPRLPGRLTVTLAYTDGQWLVEVRKGRALLGSRYLVKPTEALTMLSLLHVPALNNRVETALSSDKTEAARQVDRVRAELAELEAKLDGLTEMVDLSDHGNGAVEPRPTRRPSPR